MAQRTRVAPIFREYSIPVRLDGVKDTLSLAPAQTLTSHVVRGRSQVIAMRPLLIELGRRTGQAGVLDQVHLLVQTPTALRKIPYVVLVDVRAGVAIQDVTADDLKGAVLLYEYVLAGIPTGVFATDDIHGERTILAPRERRAEIAEQACCILVAHGAAVSLISVEGASPAPRLAQPGASLDRSCSVGMRVRVQGRDLHLQGTLEETMAEFGKNTRRNFRRYRHRAEVDLGATFVPWVRITPEEFLDLNRRSTNPVPEGEAAWRYHFVTASPNRLLCGLRAADGRWLSVIAGTRRGHVAQIEWQVNRAGLPRYSLSTVMRSFMLEHEIALGTHKLIFQGGTPHSMGLSLAPAQMLDIVVVKRGLRGWLLRHIAHRGFPKSNFLRRTLHDTALAWVA